MVPLAWLLAAVGVHAETLLEPDVPVERELAAGETHTYRLELTGADVWKVSVEQLGVDVELTLVPADGQRVVTDSPLDRAGTESLVVRSNAAARFQIEVHARERAAPRGQYRILQEQLAEVTAIDRRRLAAETTRTEAARLYALGAEGREKALAHYRQSALLWHAAGADREETRDLYCIAVLERLVGETSAALQSSRAVLPRWQQLGDRHWEAATLNELGLLLLSLGDGQEARALFRRALTLHQALNDSFTLAKLNNNICLSHLYQGQLREGLDCYEPLSESLSNLQEVQLVATVLTNIGWTNSELGEPDAALNAYHRALAMQRTSNDRKEEAKTLNNLALLHRRLWQLEDALEHYRNALAVFQELRDQRNEGRVLGNIGHIYALLGEPQRSLVFLFESLNLRRKVEDQRGEVITLINLGEIYRHLDQVDKARSSHQQALDRTQFLDDPRLQTYALIALGWDHLSLREPERALDFARQSLVQLLSIEDHPLTAEAKLLEGEAHISLGDHRHGRKSFQAALNLHQRIRNPSGQAEALVSLAKAEHSLGHSDTALKYVREALLLTEDLRTRVGASNLRATFQSWRREPYELQIELLMELHRHHPGTGLDLDALTASEQARARALLDLLSESNIRTHRGVAPELIAQRVALGRRLNAKAARRSDMQTHNTSAMEEAHALDLELASTLHELDSLEIEIRRQSPNSAALLYPQPLNALDIQRLLDDETILLEYALGENRSYLWLVTSDKVVSFELSPRRDIENVARRFHKLLSVPGAQDRSEQAKVGLELTGMLLGPIKDWLDSNRRLAVVADGALHYVPFAALPHPGMPNQPLILRHDLVSLPSASVIAELRRRRARYPLPPGRLAIFADPVFERTDRRLAQSSAFEPRATEAFLNRSTGHAKPLNFRRLPGSLREAEAILTTAPQGETLAALGFDASRSTAFRPEIRRYRVVHFATHGLIDTSSPHLSGLVLSLFDKTGKPLDGFLRAHDVFNLELQADLVVLSGCETALGKEVRGEGLLGLTRGFMYAGAQRLMASLWRVEDRATAELMTQFYRSLWADGRSPAASLRAAQMTILRQRRWKDPYYWAPFVMQGDWLSSQP